MNANGSENVFRKNQTTEGGYEATLGTSWAFKPGTCTAVILIYSYSLKHIIYDHMKERD